MDVVMFKKLAAWGSRLLCSFTCVRYSKTSPLSFIILPQHLLYYKVQKFKNVLTSLRVCTVSDFSLFFISDMYLSQVLSNCHHGCNVQLLWWLILSQNRPASNSYLSSLASLGAFLPSWLILQNAVYYTVMQSPTYAERWFCCYSIAS